MAGESTLARMSKLNPGSWLIDHSRRGVLLALLGLLCAFSWRPATAQRLGPEFQVNSYTTNWQQDPAVAMDGSGKFVVAWMSYGQDGSYRGVFGQRFDASGNALGGEFPVNSYTTWDQWYPAVASDSSGNFVVVWNSNHQDGSSYGVFGQRFSSLGSPLGSEFRINSYTTGEQFGPVVAADSTGDFLVVWYGSGQNDPVRGVFGQAFDASGSPVGSEFRVNSLTTGYQDSPAVGADAAGDFVVVWKSWSEDFLTSDLLGRRFSSTGLPVGTQFQVNGTTGSSGINPSVALAASGKFIVVWGGAPNGVVGRRFGADGTPAGGEFPVNVHTAAVMLPSPKVASESSGSFVVVWHSLDLDGSYFGVFGRRFDAAGVPVASEFQVNTYTTSHQFQPVIAADSGGDFVVSWMSDGQDGDLHGVFGQRLQAPLFADAFEAGEVCGWSAAQGSGDICPP